MHTRSLSELLLCVLVFTQSAAQTRHTLFRNMQYDDVTFVDNVSFTSVARSSLDCADQCARFSEGMYKCITFTFNPGSRTCRGHYKLMGYSYTVTSQAGSKTFQITPTNNLCRDGWAWHQNSCYQRYLQAVPYAEAKSGCEAVGSILTEITSSDENNFIRTQVIAGMTGQFIIGINSIAVGGTWVLTSSGDPVTFTGWHPGMPDQAFERCVTINSLAGPWNQGGGWNDVPCGWAGSFICEYSLV